MGLPSGSPGVPTPGGEVAPPMRLERARERVLSGWTSEGRGSRAGGGGGRMGGGHGIGG